MNPRVLVTGSNGFIGSHLIDKLLEKKYIVKCMLRKTSNTKWIKDKPYNCVYADFRETHTLKDAVKDVDEIYHLGGAVRTINNKVFYDINAQGTKNLIEAVNEHNPLVKKFVFVSSQAAWGPLGKDAVSHYGKSKALGEKWVRDLKNYVIVRPVAVYGPRDMDFLTVFKMASKGIFIKPAKGTGKLNFIHVDDCIEGIINAEIGSEIFLSDGNDYSWDDLMEILEKVFEKKIRCINLPRFLIYFSGILGTLKGKVSGIPHPLNRDKVKEIFGGDWVVPHTKGERKYSIIEGFKNTLNWYKKEGYLS